MKKHILKIVLFSILLFIGNSCTDYLTVYPENSLTKDEFWKTRIQVQQAVAGCYRAMIQTGVMERLIQFGEIRSDNVIGLGGGPTSDQTRFLNCEITSSLSLVKWVDIYRVINNCNTVLKNADFALVDPTLTKEELNSFKAEAKGIRALMYFFLVRSYRDVPLVLDPSEDDSKSYAVPKVSEDVILTQIISDLIDSKKSVMDSYNNLLWDKGRLTKTSVRALLADVYLWQGALSASKDESDKSHASYAASKAECDTLLLNKSPQIMLVDGKYLLSEVFYQGNSAESLFELQFEDKGQWNPMIFITYGSKNSPTGNVLAYASKLQTLFDATDVRFKDAYETVASANYIFKYVGAYRTVDNDNVSTYHYRSTSDAVDWIMYRLADVYLMKAEAMIELDSTATEIVPYINMTYARANESAEGLSSNLYGSKSQMRNLLRLERQREFLFEGKRWFDLIRYARTDKSVGLLANEVSEKIGSEGAYKLMNPDSWFLPVPYDDIKTSFGALVQNPFYE